MTNGIRQCVRRLRATCVALSALTLITFSATADTVYKWTDADGNVHYGDRPPADTQRHEMQLRQTPAVDPDVNTRQQRTARLLEAFAAEREEKQAERAAVAAKKKERETRCAEARAIQQKYENSAYIYTRDAAGERVILDDEAHARVMDEARTAVENWCR
jgi:hypothetical protein